MAKSKEPEIREVEITAPELQYDIEHKHVEIDRCMFLLTCLTSHEYIPSETTFTEKNQDLIPVFTENEKKTLKNKLFEIIAKF